jgi:hypothetical protein
MGVVGFLWPPDTDRPVATGAHKTPDGYAPQGVAGFIVGDAHVVCPACFREKYQEEDYGYLFQSGETDYPGTTCGDWGDCRDPAAGQGDVILPQTLLVYGQHIPEMTDRELAAVDLHRDAPPEVVHAVARARRQEGES